MNMAGLILLGAGYLLGNESARDKFGAMIQQLAGQSIDALNQIGGVPDVSKADEANTTKENG